jgi:hypothetical protein
MAFKKGQSGNPLGKPKGTGKIQPLRDMIAQALPGIIQNLIDLARAGDVSASKLLLERALPALKPTTEAVVFPITSNDSLASIGQSIIDAVSRAELQPDVAVQVLGALATQAKLVETNDLAKRIEALENLK